MKEIKTEKEFQGYRGSLKPFEPNKAIYQGEIYLFSDHGIYRVKDHSADTFVEDYFHKDFFFERGHGWQIKSGLNIIVSRRTFDTNDSDTWPIITIVGVRDVSGYNPETYDRKAFEKNCVSIYTRRYGIQELVISEEDLLKNEFARGIINKEFWFYKTEMKDLDKKLPYKKFDNTYSKVDIKKLEAGMKGDGYPVADITSRVNEAMKDNIKFGTDSLTHSVFEGLDYTFGVEIETCIGRPADKDVSELNVKAVHDGSLRDAEGNTPGGEYVTGVLKGDSGLVQLHEICRVLSNSCDIDEKCGVHVHIGSLDWNKENIVYSYILAELLEDEIFSILPKSRRNNSYCRKLTAVTLKKFEQLAQAKNKSQYNIIIDDMYDDIYKEVTYIKGNNRARFADADGDEDTQNSEMLTSSRELNRSRQHPLGAKCGYNKDAQRYCWLNYVTLLYNTKGGNSNSRTLEFRPHSATMNFIKIRNWTKICFAFCAFVERNKADINTGSVTLEKVISSIYPKTGEVLIKYIRERKEVFKTKGESIDHTEEVIAGKKSIKEVVCA